LNCAGAVRGRTRHIGDNQAKGPGLPASGLPPANVLPNMRACRQAHTLAPGGQGGGRLLATAEPSLRTPARRYEMRARAF
jgi:hypothetical protein